MSCAGSGRDSWGHRIIASLWSRAWVGGGGTGGRGAASLERAEGGSPIGNTRPGPAAPLASSQGPCPVLHLSQLLPKGAPQHTMPKALGCQHPSTWAPWQLAICKAPRRKLNPHTQILLSGLTLLPAKASMAPAIHSPDAFLAAHRTSLSGEDPTALHTQCSNSRTSTGWSEKHSSSLCFITGILQKGKVPPSITTPRSGCLQRGSGPVSATPVTGSCGPSSPWEWGAVNSVWEEGPASLLAIQRLHTPRVPSAPPWVPHRQHGQRWGCSAQLTPHLLPVCIWALTRAEHTHECCPAGPALLHPRPPSPPCSQRGESRAVRGAAEHHIPSAAASPYPSKGISIHPPTLQRHGEAVGGTAF